MILRGSSTVCDPIDDIRNRRGWPLENIVSAADWSPVGLRASSVIYNKWFTRGSRTIHLVPSEGIDSAHVIITIVIDANEVFGHMTIRIGSAWLCLEIGN